MPLLERLKFLSIVSSNLDEFFMIRVAGIEAATGGRARPHAIPAGLTAAEQLERVSARTHEMMAEHSAAVTQAFEELAGHGLRVRNWAELPPAQREYLTGYFQAEVLPVLTPLAVEELTPFPVLPGLALNIAVELPPPEEAPERPRFAVVPIPGNLPRFISARGETEQYLIPLEQVIGGNLGALFPDQETRRVGRVSRHAGRRRDGGRRRGRATCWRRRRRRCARDAAGTSCAWRSPRTRRRNCRAGCGEWCELSEEDVYPIAGLVNARDVLELVARPGLEHLRYPSWPPQPPRDLLGDDGLVARGAGARRAAVPSL